jgi:DNA-binding IclR family transcriptional regulator
MKAGAAKGSKATRATKSPRASKGAAASVDKTLQKGLAIIELLSDAGRPLGVSEIAQALSLTKSNVHRLLQSLCTAGWVIRNSSRGAYDLSLRVWEVGVKRLSTLNLPQIAYRQANQLALTSEESVHIAVLEQMEVVFLDTIDTPKPIRAYAPVGGRAPAYCVATGKAILAFMREEDIKPALGALTSFTEKTITDQRQLLSEFALIRRRGYSINRSEWQQGVDGVAAPIFAGNTIVGSIGLSGPADRFGAVAMKRFIPMVVEAAATISRELQSRPISSAA